MGVREQRGVEDAIRKSALSRLPSEVVDELLADSMILQVAPGATPQRQGAKPHSALVLSGLWRIFHTTIAGREVTVRYARGGEFLGIPTLYMGRAHALSSQALTTCGLLVLQPPRLLAVAQRDVRVANLFAEETAKRLMHVLDELAGNTFASMRQRVVRHLLDLAAGPAKVSNPLVARVTQQELADAVGSVREVVVRLLRDLREEGFIRTGRDEIELLDADRLHAETFAHE